jgi:hypothetical protein
VRFLRGAASKALGLFVSDWTQAVGILVILVLGYAVNRQVHSPLVGYAVALALALHLVATTTGESRRRRSGR